MTIGRAPLLAALLSCGASACVTKGEGEKIWAEVRAIQAQNNEILRSLNENKSRLVSLMRDADVKIGDLSKKIEQAESILRRSNVDFFQQLQQLQTELSKTSGRIEQVERSGEVLKRDLDGFREDTSRRIGKIEASATQQQQTPTQKEPQNTLPSNPSAAFSQAQQALTSGNFAQAVQLFLGNIKQFPQHPQMEDVQWGLAEAYLGQQDWKHALAEYSRFYQDFGASQRAAEALFKVAQCYENQGDFRTALLSLTVITKKFSRSPFAKEAKKRMKTLKKKVL